jgi:hypothetical protein
MKKLIILLVLLAVLIPASVSAISPTVALDNKNPDTWARITDDRLGSLSYNESGATFDFTFTATGMEATTDYSLIYFANPYPGNNPGGLIKVGTSDGDGNLSISGSVNIGSIPRPPDANMLIDHSVPPDNYTTAYGAKIWLVPSDCYSSITKSITVWTPTRFLFETNMINYVDTDEGTGEGVDLTSTVTEPASSIGLSVSPPSVGYGSVAIGSCSTEYPITLTNTGTVPIRVTASTSAGFYTACLKINDLTANGWISGTIPVSGHLDIITKVCPTASYSGTLTGTVSFVASFAP